jgi:GntR family transcriptional regulator
MQSNNPKYRQIKERLRRLIADGRIDHRVPSENELARQYLVSRMTARKALNELLREGLVERIAGKGTFVRQPQITQTYFHFHAFSENARQLGVQAGSRILQSAIGTLPDRLAGKIPGKRAVCIRRVHLLDDRPVCYELRYLRKDWCRPILDEDLTDRSVHALIVDKLGLPITRVWQRLEAVSLRQRIADALEVAAGAPALCMQQLLYSAEAPLSCVDYYLRSDVYAFEDSFEPGRIPAAGWIGNGAVALNRGRR